MESKKTLRSDTMSDERTVKRQVVIDTTPELAFEAVTKASELREWLCDEAWTDARPGGRWEVRWRSGFRAEGKFTALDAPHRAAWTWLGTGEPGPTAVEFTVEPAEGGVQVTVLHSGFGPGAEWDSMLAESEDGWTDGLDNLRSTLETGVDLRFARRPFLGIHFDIMSADRAAKEGIATEQGIYLNEAVQDGAARAAGLGKGDVIVAIGGIETPGYNELLDALSARRAGDVVPVKVVRGRVRETVQVTLGERPSQELPSGAGELADLLAAQYREADAALKAALESVGDQEAGQHPVEGEWSVKEVLAHLSLVERDQHSYLGVFALDGWLDTGPTNPTTIPGRLTAAVSVVPTVDGLLERFLADEAETVEFVRRLPDEVVSHKARFRRIAQNMIGLPEHSLEHIEQIRSTLAAIRG
jgi:uncharacterized protein YndB with AHSA1/START domain